MISNIQSGAEVILKHLDPKQTWQWESTVLSETPGYRLVTRYYFHGNFENHPADIHETVGKFYTDELIGEHCFNAMNTLHRVLAKQSNPPLAIPEPLFYFQENKLLSLKWVGFQPLTELMDTRQYKHYLRMAGKALAYLHQLPVNYGDVKTVDDHLTELITPQPLHLAELIPELATRIHTIVEKLCQLERSGIAKQAPVPLHRDFHLRQLFCDTRKVWVIDWDMYSLGDPALDIGNFLVYLETRLPDKSKASKAAFLEGYCSLIPIIHWPNINLYRAMTYLRLVCKAFRLQQPDWEVRANHFLATCEKILSRDN